MTQAFPESSKKRRFIIIGLVAIIALLIGCATAPQVNQAQPTVTVPADIQTLMDQLVKDMRIFDIDKLRTHFSDNYKQDGRNREQHLSYLSGISGAFSKCEQKITKFEVDKNNPYIVHYDGYFSFGSGDNYPFTGRMLIKEDGKWKFYGNQE